MKRKWECSKCGTEVLAKEKPNSLNWEDKHICIFEEIENEN